jgi:N-dimethylarginine dimethylaminohydrolase
VIEDVFDAEVIALKLADPRFYHMDTALCPLPRGEVMFVPSAFTREGKATIYERTESSQRIEVGIDDAYQLAANAVCIGDVLVLSDCGDRLHSHLKERGYRVLTTPLRSFLRSGGAAFCLTLRLDRLSSRVSSAVNRAAAE